MGQLTSDSRECRSSDSAAPQFRFLSFWRWKCGLCKPQSRLAVFDAAILPQLPLPRQLLNWAQNFVSRNCSNSWMTSSARAGTPWPQSRQKSLEPTPVTSPPRTARPPGRPRPVGAAAAGRWLRRPAHRRRERRRSAGPAGAGRRATGNGWSRSPRSPRVRHL